MTFVAFNSPRGRHMRREQRIHVRPGPANAVAVHVVFDALGYVVNEGSLTRSMATARTLVHRAMEEYDASPRGGYAREATLTPITAVQACVACNTGGIREYRKLLWLNAQHSIGHMTRVRALGQMACLYGMLPDNVD